MTDRASAGAHVRAANEGCGSSHGELMSMRTWQSWYHRSGRGVLPDRVVGQGYNARTIPPCTRSSGT